MTVRSYRDLDVWQKAINLAIEAYRVARQFPMDERFALTAHTCRAAVSIASNIAEGQERRGTREFLNHLSIARGSLAELETCLQIAERLRYVNDDRLRPARDLASDVGRMLARLRQALSKSVPPRPASRASRLGPRLAATPSRPSSS